jgi:hypothetical protein
MIEYGQEYKQIRRRELKQDLFDALGGECQCCGYNYSIAAIDFHHIFEGKKSAEPCTLINDAMGPNGHISDQAFKIILKEIKKCAPLCSNCHREYHVGDLHFEPYLVEISKDKIEELKNEWLTNRMVL